MAAQTITVETNFNPSASKRLKMVKKELISKPLPILLQGSEYNDIPVDPGPKNISTFEKPSSSYGWLHSLWANIISAKWGGNLMPATSDLPAPIKISKPLSYNSEPSHVSISPARPGSCRLTLIS